MRSLYERLIAFLEGLDVELKVELTEETSLITSGLFDSMALFQLAIWIEQELGVPLDLTELNLVEEWNTIADILNFIEKHRVTGQMDIQ